MSKNTFRRGKNQTRSVSGSRFQFTIHKEPAVCLCVSIPHSVFAKKKNDKALMMTVIWRWFKSSHSINIYTAWSSLSKESDHFVTKLWVSPDLYSNRVDPFFCNSDSGGANLTGIATQTLKLIFQLSSILSINPCNRRFFKPSSIFLNLSINSLWGISLYCTKKNHTFEFILPSNKRSKSIDHLSVNSSIHQSIHPSLMESYLPEANRKWCKRRLALG